MNKYTQIILGLILFALALQLYPIGLKWWNSNIPIADWFSVNQMQVPAVVTKNETIFIIFDRTIRKPFYGEWLVEVQKINEDGTVSVVCSGNGEANYTPNKSLPHIDKTSTRDATAKYANLPKIGVTLSWFLNNQSCEPVLTAGNHRIYARWKIDRGPFFEPYILEKISNIFSIILSEK